MFRKLMGTTDDLTLTILRLVLGVIFFAHGAQRCSAGLADIAGV
jgi:uncharacterized membrane protein YphA (DoxX/SURF4 family)